LLRTFSTRRWIGSRHPSVQGFSDDRIDEALAPMLEAVERLKRARDA